MGSDYERWKKRRDAQRRQREEEAQRPSRPSSYPSGAPPPASPSGYSAGEAPHRVYQGYIPPPPEPSPARRKNSGRGRGCIGCLGLLLGTLLLALLFVTIAGTLYWRQIEQRGQVNLLILGIDERPNEGDAFRSDTMILAGFDPRDREVALLNIPRDLWVTIPGVGQNRINTAHFFGGPLLSKETVRTEFNIPLHYYVELNFNGFISLIDAMGGITIDVPEPLHDENYPTPDYGVTTIDIPAGVQEMDGETALIYARSRYSTSDFDRSRRQQEIIQAIREKLLQPRTWLKAREIFGAARIAVRSDMPQSEWPALVLILLRSEISRHTIGPDSVQEFITNQGAQVLIPDWSQINPILAQYFE